MKQFILKSLFATLTLGLVTVATEAADGPAQQSTIPPKAQAEPKPKVEQSSVGPTKENTGAWSEDRREAIRRALLEALHPGDLNDEERQSIRVQIAAMFGQGKQFNQLNVVEMLRVLERAMMDDSRPNNGDRFSGNRRPMAGPGNARRTGPPANFSNGDRRFRNLNNANKDWRLPGIAPGVAGEQGGNREVSRSPFLDGIFEEESNLNLESAMRSYQGAIHFYERQREDAAYAVFRLGECQRKLGKLELAKRHYQRVVKEFGEQTRMRELAENALKQLEAKTN